MIATAGRIFFWPHGLFICVSTYATLAYGVEPHELQVGDLAPQFQAIDQDGNGWKSVDHVRMQFVVVFFYQGDFRSRCVRQVHDYCDKSEFFKNNHVEVIGMSGDAQQTHRLFANLHGLSVTLLSDFDGALANVFGVPFVRGGKARVKDLDGLEVFPADSNRRSLTVRRGVTSENCTFIIGRDGTIIYRKRNPHPAKDTQQVVEFIKGLKRK